MARRGGRRGSSDDALIHPEPGEHVVAVREPPQRAAADGAAADVSGSSASMAPAAPPARRLTYYNPTSLDSKAVQWALSIPIVQFLAMFYHSP